MPPTLFQLPAELMDMVGAMLAPASKGCLALTCRTYYEQFKSVFEHNFFDFIGIETEIARKPGFHSNKFSRCAINRSIFLSQAQTDNWPYCGSCRLLHPSNEFEPEELEKKTELKNCKWPTMSLSNAPMKPINQADGSLYYLPSVSPWTYTHFFPEFGFPRIPLMRLEHGRDEEQSTITARMYYFDHIPFDFHSPYPMVCPHISLFGLFDRQTRECGSRDIMCEECDTWIRVSTKFRIARLDVCGEPCACRSRNKCDYVVEVYTKLGPKSLSGKEEWWA
ncbi:uncharacterized protein N7496_007292 [Penicillium cataractarum]|uniref:F-box domain-containing protein n=1 Tax=Penicillium cataractarum TaxID=2100454 RepID=A0A9W9V9C6_9EURO|nr:uncharacterized protein N7496_007292 [Penicillium cataractarum]KAJ5371200.1 hypothetical protein N7496_007292 [Penicillium cataractarum]